MVADDLELLVSDRALAAKDAFQAGEEHAAATAEADRLRAELEQAQLALETARSGAESASFAPAAAGVLRMPTRADGYVFPVGGGPGAVSVGHHHHDYPAADIAAPLGAPLYALADGLVLSVVDDGRCGTGLVLQTLDGLEWVYCHLSYRDPGLEPGLLVSAGQWVGLVGSTGHSTGPASPSRPASRALPAGDAVVPGVRGDRLHVAGRARGCGRCGRRPSSRSFRPKSRSRTSSSSHSRGVEFARASAEGRGMTAGVIGRLPRVGLIVCAICLVTGTLAYAATSTLSAPSTPAVAPTAAAPRAARRPRRPQAGLRLCEGLARAGWLCLARRGLRARLRRQRRRRAVARSRARA